MRMIKERQIGASNVGYVIYGVENPELVAGELPAEAILYADLNDEVFVRGMKFEMDIVRICRGEDPRWKLVELTFYSGMLEMTLFDTECYEELDKRRKAAILIPTNGDFGFMVTVFNRQYEVPDTYEIKGFRDGPLDEEGDKLTVTILESINGRLESFSRFVRRGFAGWFKHSRLRW